MIEKRQLFQSFFLSREQGVGEENRVSFFLNGKKSFNILFSLIVSSKTSTKSHSEENKITHCLFYLNYSAVFLVGG